MNGSFLKNIGQHLSLFKELDVFILTPADVAVLCKRKGKLQGIMDFCHLGIFDPFFQWILLRINSG